MAGSGAHEGRTCSSTSCNASCMAGLYLFLISYCLFLSCLKSKAIHKSTSNGALQVMVMQPGAGAAQQAIDFKHGSINQVLITSYETLRKFAAQLAGGCDLLICDEGHRCVRRVPRHQIICLPALHVTHTFFEMLSLSMCDPVNDTVQNCTG